MQIMTWARTVALGGALLLVACVPPQQSSAPAFPGQAPEPTPPPVQSMDQSLTLGLWTSNFGPVKIERDTSGGEDAVMGAWVYDREGVEVIGFFTGTMRGNLLQFTWHEPAAPADLVGRGFISFRSDGMSFNGRWWTADRQREGAFTGERQQIMAPEAGASDAFPDDDAAPAPAPEPAP